MHRVKSRTGPGAEKAYLWLVNAIIVAHNYSYTRSWVGNRFTHTARNYMRQNI